jgi:hypothetical protein
MKSVAWRARPRNLSQEGIHDDDTARRLGFAGGFVPGVALYSHVVAALLSQGADWLREGSVEYRFRRPVYDAEEVRFTIEAGGPAFTIASPDGSDVRASGPLSIPTPPPAVPPVPPATPRRAPLGSPDQIGVPLQVESFADPERAAAAVGLCGEYAWQEDGRALYPVSLWLNPIALIREHFDSPVPIHYGGRVWHHSPVYVGETVVKRGHITGFEERNGNKIVAFVVAIETAGGRPVATVEHTSVYSLARAADRHASTPPLPALGEGAGG